MTLAGRSGSILSLLNGLWAAYLALLLMATPRMCPSGGCPVILATYFPTLLLAVAVVLTVDSLVSFTGFKISFMLGAVLSALVLALVVVQWGSFTGFVHYISAALSLLAVAADAAASRPGKAISEQNHPLNLPVFG